MDILIPDTELMAEKLGMIVLCSHCGKRIDWIKVGKVYYWNHIDNDSLWCGNSGEWRACSRK
jgi:hypothetical protein